MRILMVSQMMPYLPCQDGFRVTPAHLLRELSGRHTLALLATRTGVETPRQRQWAEQFCAMVETVPASQWRQLFGGEPGPGLALLQEALHHLIEDFAPDVLHLEGAMLAPLARTAGLPTLLAIHDSRALRARDFRRLATPPWAWARARWIERAETAWERRWFSAADACVTLSPEDAAAVAPWVDGGRVHTIPNGIDTGLYAFRRIGRPGRMVFTGNFAWPPNVDAARRFALGVFPLVRRRWPQAELVLAGASPVDAVRRLATIPGVEVTGTVPDLRPSIWSASVYVSPLRAGFGVKNKILEAMALGTPIVASPRSLTGLAHVVPDRDLLLRETDDAMADAVVGLLADPGAAGALASRAREVVERHYTWTHVATRHEQLLERLARSVAPAVAAA